jgi:two-component SAPR family response regulator
MINKLLKMYKLVRDLIPDVIPIDKLSLYKFSVKDGSYEIVSSPIPIISEKIETDINLFYNDNTNKFYCSIQEFTDPPRSSVKVYSLSGPPVSTALYLQSHIAKKLMPLNLICWALAGLILLAPFITAWVLLKNKRRKEAISYDALTAENETAIDKHELENKKNAVYLLGEFVVFSKNGKDITYLFSPKIRQLFLLILLNSKNGNGVNSKKISHALWPDKDVAKTKNIKGVTFNHLRNILSDINGIELVFNDAYSFQFDSTFFCDYFFVNGLLKEPCGADCDELLSKHFSLVSRGMFLGDMTDPWLDDIKVVYEDMLIEVTSPQLQKLYTAEEYKHVLKLAKLILAIDPFNDIAFKYQLKSLKRLRGIEYAKKVYDHFSIEYRKSLDIDYHLNFDKILH